MLIQTQILLLVLNVFFFVTAWINIFKTKRNLARLEELVAENRVLVDKINTFHEKTGLHMLSQVP